MKLFLLAFAALNTAALAAAASVNNYLQVNLLSDLPNVAASQDTDLVNPWGIVATPNSPFWVTDNGTGLSTIYTGNGSKLGLVVTVPPPMGGTPPSAPTGIVANTTANFGGATFIFDTEDGTISSWSGSNVPITAAALQVTSPAGSVYKGLATGMNGSNELLYATNFGLGRIDVFDSSFHPATVSGGFTDPNLPAGYAPFGIQNINGNLYVSYALQDAEHHDDVSGAGHGFIDVFSTNGVLLQRLVTQGALNSPWGLALAPSNFGAFSNDLLVGNFGDGSIHAYDPANGALLGTLENSSGNPIAIQGLWGLDFGNGNFGAGLDSLYFTAGIPGPGMVEDHGLFGELLAAPEPSAAILIGGTLSVAAIFCLLQRLRSLVQSASK
jgi:uncharacterized protein (TIGR03118 family)